MASIGHPVLGDLVYGPKKQPVKVEGGQLLHAFRLGFVHPTTGERMRLRFRPKSQTGWQGCPIDPGRRRRRPKGGCRENTGALKFVAKIL